MPPSSAALAPAVRALAPAKAKPASKSGFSMTPGFERDELVKPPTPRVRPGPDSQSAPRKNPCVDRCKTRRPAADRISAAVLAWRPLRISTSFVADSPARPGDDADAQMRAMSSTSAREPGSSSNRSGPDAAQPERRTLVTDGFE